VKLLVREFLAAPFLLALLGPSELRAGTGADETGATAWGGTGGGARRQRGALALPTAAAAASRGRRSGPGDLQTSAERTGCTSPPERLRRWGWRGRKALRLWVIESEQIFTFKIFFH